jgi:hypothetical protein
MCWHALSVRNRGNVHVTAEALCSLGKNFRNVSFIYLSLQQSSKMCLRNPGGLIERVICSADERFCPELFFASIRMTRETIRYASGAI